MTDINAAPVAPFAAAEARYLDRFPADHRASAERAYNDGLSDGADGASFDQRELATVLAALRAWQKVGSDPIDGLSNAEIDALCQRLEETDREDADPVNGLKALIAAGLTYSQACTVFGDDQLANEPHLNAYRDAVSVEDGALECDDNAIVSESSDGGAYVATWTWVSDEEAGIETLDDEAAPASCENCGCTDNDGSDVCPDCGGAIIDAEGEAS